MSDEIIENKEAIVAIPAPEQEKLLVPITDENKEAFFKAFLADESYKEEFQLFDGKMPVLFRTITLNENDVVFAQIAMDQEKGVAKNDDSYFVKVVEYRLAGCLVSINNEAFCKDITLESHPNNKTEGTTYLSERLKIMQQWQTFKLGAITEAFNRFEAKVRRLTEECFKENF